MKRIVILMSLAALMISSIKLISSKNESIKPSLRMQNAFENTKAGSLNNKTTPYNAGIAGSRIIWMLEVKMPINEMIEPNKEGC